MAEAAEGESNNANEGFCAPRPKAGRQGRPRIIISREELEAFHKAGYSGVKMAHHFKCSAKHVYKRLKEERLKRYVVIENDPLDNVVKEIKDSFPNAGGQMTQGCLAAKGIVVQRQRVRDSLHRVDPEGCGERWSAAVHRRVYKVPTPNALWHMDGHMKLIRWGFTTHGCIDGYSRMITFLGCGTDNRSSSVLNYFVNACHRYGVPTRVRSDHGAENTKVALFLNLVRGRDHHLTGKSVHNERIERLWKDVHHQVTSNYHQLFHSLESDETINLDPSSDVHRAALQYIYLPAINSDLQIFKKGWNHHKVRTEGHRTPHQIWLSGMLDNMGTEFTAPSELFGSSNHNVIDSIETGLARYGLTLHDVQQDDESVVSPSPSLLSNEQLIQLNEALGSIPCMKEKLTMCIRVFHDAAHYSGQQQ